MLMTLLGTGRHTYRTLSRNAAFFTTALVVMTALAPLILRDALRSYSWFVVAWLGVLAWFWFNVLFRISYRIEIDGDSVEFSAALRRYRTTMSRIRSIRSSANISTVRWDDGRVDLWGSFDGWLDFVNSVKAANPDVELKGI
jgi:hypothetical protein